MKITHGWYEKDPDADVFKVLSSVTIQLTAGEKWELSLILGDFISKRKQSGSEAGLKMAESLNRQLVEDPNPNVPFYKKENQDLRRQLRESNERSGNTKVDSL